MRALSTGYGTTPWSVKLRFIWRATDDAADWAAPQMPARPTVIALTKSEGLGELRIIDLRRRRV